MADMYMSLAYPNDSSKDGAPNRIEHVYSGKGDKRENSSLSKSQSYDEMQGTAQPAHMGSQSTTPDKE
jgi:hypothetical protein